MLIAHRLGAPGTIDISSSGIVSSTDPAISAELAGLQQAINAAANALKMGDVVTVDGKIGRETVLGAIAVARAAASSVDMSKVTGTKTFGDLLAADASKLGSTSALKPYTTALADDRKAVAQTFAQIASLLSPAAPAPGAKPDGKGHTKLWWGIGIFGAVAVVATTAIVLSRRRPAPALRPRYA